LFQLYIYMSKPSVHLIIPGILDSLGKLEKPSEFKSLQLLLSRSDKILTEISGYYPLIANQFNLADIDQQTLPVAAVSYYAETGKQDSLYRMHFDLVHIQADKDRLILQGHQILSVLENEKEDLLAELNKTYQEDQFTFESHDSQHGYLTLAQKPDCSFHLLEDVLGRSVEPFLPQGKDKLFWHRFLNEVQMLFHASPVNQVRLESNQLPVNSIWCWGNGPLPESVSSQWSTVLSNNLFARGLAELSGAKTKELPEQATTLLTNITEGNTLLVFDQDERDILSLDHEYHQQRLEKFEKNWFIPLLQGLKQGRLDSITLSDTTGKTFHLKKIHLKRFWRKQYS